jgi:hypothetical protein
MNPGEMTQNPPLETLVHLLQTKRLKLLQFVDNVATSERCDGTAINAGDQQPYYCRKSG